MGAQEQTLWNKWLHKVCPPFNLGSSEGIQERLKPKIPLCATGRFAKPIRGTENLGEKQVKEGFDKTVFAFIKTTVYYSAQVCGLKGRVT